MRLSCFALSCLAFTVFAVNARGQEPDSPARVLFREGRELAARGDYLSACPKFEQSLVLEVGIGTQFNLADCWEHIGRNASAQALFLGAAATAKALGQLEREQVLRERAVALEPRVTKLVVEVNSTEPRLIVKRDALPLEPEQWGRALAIDSGKYVFTAKAPHKRVWTETVVVKPGDSVVTVVVPELKPEPVSAAEAGVAAPARTEAPHAPKKLASSAPTAGQADDRAPNYPVLALAGLGVGSLALGTVMGLRFRNANEDARLVCPKSTDCSEAEITEHDRLVDKASSARTFAYVGLAGGVACLGGAALLYVLERPRNSSSARIRALPVVGESGFYGGVVSGSF